jgi:hypothetical protein
MMAYSKRTSYDSQLVETYLTRLQSDIEVKWRGVKCIRDELALLVRSRPVDGRPLGEKVRTVTQRLDHMLATNHIVRETLLELREAAQALARDLDDESR